MNIEEIKHKALAGEFLSLEEGLLINDELSTTELMAIANAIRQRLHPNSKVGWIIDRNVNYTNVCYSGCQFCNFSVGKNSKRAYITQMEEYDKKIGELYELGGRQLLLQGGHHPELGLDFYVELFSSLKQRYPEVKLHALGPPEIVHISKLEKLSYKEVLRQLMDAGLDSLPGAGAEVLVDRVRAELSKNKCSSDEWFSVMRAAHKLGLTTSVTMMLGHVETVEERFTHLIRSREVQAEKPESAKGFISFIPWPFQSEGTALKKRLKQNFEVSADEYIRFIALSRIMLPNVPNIQASWLTVGKEIGQICLHAGANDFGSIMIEENVVSVAGADHKFDAEGIQRAIREAGFEPYQRDQQFREV